MIGEPIALRIRRKIERPSKSLVRAFAKAQTSFIADSMQGWNCLHHSIKGLNPKQTFAGPALTALGGPQDNIAAMAMLDFAKPGDVLVIATGWDEKGAVIGDIWAAVAKQKGVVGIVTDGLVRDATGCEKMGPPIFCRGLSPNAGYKNGPGEINGVVSLGGVSISPGDIIIGDRDGVAVVPRLEAPAIKKSLDQVIKAEAAKDKQVRAGKVKNFWDEKAYAARGVDYVD